MTDDLHSRGLIADQLAALSTPGQPLHTDADHNTSLLYAGDISRFAFRKRVISAYLERENPARGGVTAIVSAGSPGSGKTTALRDHVPDLNDYRILDPDIIKDDLIEQALHDGLYDDLLARILDDGHPLAPRELASLVHRESTQLIDQIRRICISRRENIVVEGTLTWKGLAPKLVAEFTEGEYQHVEVMAIEADRATAHERALSRWWSGRQEWIAGIDRLGGRFTPPAAIDICYTDAAQSLCTQHAVELEELASVTISHTRVTVLRRDTSGRLITVLERRHPRNR
ncbi:zeta toxin family protein [Rhodococcus triatomae]|nr:zeta toxin protein [Rhodococcus triatomae BKS 15-14]